MKIVHFWYGKNSSEIKTECYRAGGGRMGGVGFYWKF